MDSTDEKHYNKGNSKRDALSFTVHIETDRFQVLRNRQSPLVDTILGKLGILIRRNS